MGAYDHLNKEELIALLEKRQAERKLGLVWERNEIEHDQALAEGFVALELDETLTVGGIRAEQTIGSTGLGHGAGPSQFECLGNSFLTLRWRSGRQETGIFQLNPAKNGL